jgi:hypothetical protein
MSEPPRDVGVDELEARVARMDTWPTPALGLINGLLRRLDDAGLATQNDFDDQLSTIVALEGRKDLTTAPMTAARELAHNVLSAPRRTALLSASPRRQEVTTDVC